MRASCSQRSTQATAMAQCCRAVAPARQASRGRCARIAVNAVQTSGYQAASPSTVELGKSGLTVSGVGVGAWSWGDRSGYWGYGKSYGDADNLAAYEAMVESGLTFLDTAEVYGSGKSEELIREFMARTGTRPLIATKFAPLPWRFTAASVVTACRASLARLGEDRVALYMIHWPGFLTNGLSNDAYVRGLGDCHDLGLCDAVGVSNFRPDRIRSAHAALADRGIALSSNQVQYSLLYREPERNGVLETCRELGVTVTAYSPLCQGLLTGKYTPGGKGPGGPRSVTFTDANVRRLQPLLGLMREIGAAHGDRSTTQVAINWCQCKGTVPLVGAKNARQMAEIQGAMGWSLSPEAVRDLDAASEGLTLGFGAPFEKW